MRSLCKSTQCPFDLVKIAYLAGRYLVFHGGSGSEKHEIKTAVDFGVVKMNVDTGGSRLREKFFPSADVCFPQRYPMGIPYWHQGD